MTTPTWPLLRMREMASQLMEHYPQHREPRFTIRRFKHKQLQKQIDNLDRDQFEVSVLGRSFQNREIYQVKWGAGPRQLLFWSQMHGNEATATLALFDLWSYLSKNDDPNIQDLRSKVSLYFIPMLNPDGAELFQRRTAMGIDMNRDARRLVCPESRLLKEIAQKLKPDFGFNLHDQNIYYTAGKGPETAALSFLAPAYNETKEINDTRRNAIRLIGGVVECLKPIIHQRMGRYDDAYEPRAFGELMQRSGISTLLIESGAWPGDMEKQYIRQLNFVALILAITLIAENYYPDISESYYWDIPQNESNLHDLVIRNLKIKDRGKKSYYVDVAIRREELENQHGLSFYHKGIIEDVGDLSTMHGYDELSGQDLVYRQPGIYPDIFDNLNQAKGVDPYVLMRKGYTALRIKNLHPSLELFPLDLISESSAPDWGLEPEKPASFLLKHGDQVRFAVINGFLYDLSLQTNSPLGNGWHYR